MRRLAYVKRHRHMPLRDRLRAAIVVNERGCWIWQGAVTSQGYGAVKRHGRQMAAHRASYEEFIGPIPDGLTLDHTCRDPRSINPEHLDPVTQRENTLRGIGVTARLSRKTHCKHGHEFTLENTYRGGSPRGRRCRTCRREQARSRNAGLR